MTRRFPAPWSVRELEQAFRIEDTGQAVAYTHFRKDENEARQANVLTWDEARRIAANMAKLPELVTQRLKSPGCLVYQADVATHPHRSHSN